MLDETIERSEPVEATEQPIKKVTLTVKRTKPRKDPGRDAAGKRLAEHNRKVREVKRAREGKNDIDLNVKTENNGNSSSSSSSFSLTQVLSVVSIVVSLAGLYYKREELKASMLSLVKPKDSEAVRPEV